ncbi:WD40 repeat domain-containing protein [Myxococcus sp. AM010]|nr:WD40 repeat domain-containing protein [Myxococcus sp. AM010]
MRSVGSATASCAGRRGLCRGRVPGDDSGMRLRSWWWVLVLLTVSCAGRRSSPEAAVVRDGRSELFRARGDAAIETKQWALAAGSFAAARHTEDSPMARWGQVWAEQRASPLEWAKQFEGSVLALAFSPDGRLLASGGYDSVVRVWDVEAGAQVAELKGHDAELHALAFSPDGRWLAAAGRPGTLWLWDWKQGRRVALLSGHTEVVRGLAFSPEGEWLASGGLDQTVRVWRLRDGAEVLRFMHDDIVIAVAFSPDGARLVSSSMDRTARVWDLPARRELHRLTGHGDMVASCAFSADGERVMTASADQAIRFWDARTGALLDVQRNPGTLSAVAIAAGFQQLVQAGWEGRVQRVDVRGGGEVLERLDAHRTFVMAVALSPDGRTFASGGMDGVLKVWSRPERPPDVLLRELPAWPEVLAPVGPDAFVSGGEDGLRSWSVSSSGELHSRLETPDAVGAVAVSADRRLLAVGTLKGEVRVRDVRSGSQVMVLPAARESIRALAFSPDGALLAAGVAQDVVLWAVPSATQVARLTGHTGKPWALAFDATGQRLASGSADHTVRVWEVARGAVLRVLEAGDRVRAVAFLASGALLTAGMRQPIRLWNPEDGRVLTSMDARTVGVLSLAMAPQGAFMASGGMGGEVKVWRLPDGALMGEAPGQQGFVSAVAFSSDGAWLAAAASDRTFHLLRFEDFAHPPPVELDLARVLRRHGMSWDDSRRVFTLH